MNLMSVCHKTWSIDWVDWLKVDGDNLESDSDPHWSKLGKVANAGGRKKFLFSIQKKKKKKKNPEQK